MTHRIHQQESQTIVKRTLPNKKKDFVSYGSEMIFNKTRFVKQLKQGNQFLVVNSKIGNCHAFKIHVD